MGDYFMTPCPYCDEIFEDADEFFERMTTCDENNDY